MIWRAVSLSFCTLALGVVIGGATACADDPAPPPSDKAPPRPTGGCSKANQPRGFLGAQKLTVRSEARSYDLFVPETDGKTPLPLVFVFHGAGGTGADIRAAHGLEAEANGKAFFVYPDGLNKDWKVEDVPSRNDDMFLFDAIIERMTTDFCVDRGRVFATGFSRGGYFANQLGCKRGGALRAIASHGGGGPFGTASEYDERGNLLCPEAPVAALLVHGVDDAVVKPSESQKARDHWSRVNGCRSGTTLFPPAPCGKLAACAQERPVVMCEVPGLGHAIWPGDGARVTWSFFSSF